MYELTVVEPFALDHNGQRLRFGKGGEITDPALVERVEKDFPRHVVRRAVRPGALRQAQGK